jgi:hypothetical protein
LSKSIKLFLIFGILLFAIATQITIFVIQPIGAVPEGKTLVILRLNKTNFIDSADAMCNREMGGVSLFCRAMTVASVVEKSYILMKLPYSEFLYKYSTNGMEFRN